MKFRVLFTAVAFLALSTLAFGQAYINFNYYNCPDEAAMSSYPCFAGTPIPNGSSQLEIYEYPATFLGYNGFFNGDGDPVYCGPGYFAGMPPITWFVGRTVYCAFWSPTTTHMGGPCGQNGHWAVRDSCRYTTYNHPWTTVLYDNAVETTRDWWFCECFSCSTCVEQPLENDDLGDLGVTPMPPLPSPECPNVGPQGVPYPTGPHAVGPCHAVPSMAWLGYNVNAEAIPKIQDLDQFDDGVVFVGPFPWDACTMEQVIVTVSGAFTSPVFLSGWKDGNVDGDFADLLCGWPPRANEWIIQDAPIPAPGVYAFSFLDPGCSTDQIDPYDGVFRFRLSRAPMGAGWWMGGHDELGEVEDYYVEGLQLPVELTAAPTVTAGDRTLTLSFNVSDETDVNTYEIWRDGVKVTDITKANGSYSYADKNLINNRLYNYTIVAVGLNERVELSFDGKTVWSGSPSYLNATVTEYALHQNYPNPFNPSTEIIYDVLQTGVVTLKVFNVMGQEVATLVNGTVETGRHAATFNATGLTSGLYFYTITIGDQFSATKKMLLVQ